MAGRICENIFINDITNGASNDIEKATSLIKKYLNLFCMDNSNKFYGLIIDNNQFNDEYGDKIKNDKDEKAIGILNDLYFRTEELILDNMQIIEDIKTLLLKKQTIYKEDLDKIING